MKTKNKYEKLKQIQLNIAKTKAKNVSRFAFILNCLDVLQPNPKGKTACLLYSCFSATFGQKITCIGGFHTILKHKETLGGQLYAYSGT